MTLRSLAASAAIAMLSLAGSAAPAFCGDAARATETPFGFVVIGIHTPEFPFERSASNVQTALKRHGITYPVAQDNDSQTWNAYRNRYWPAQYIVDQNGKIVFQHDGEGQYEAIDRTVARLLNAAS